MDGFLFENKRVCSSKKNTQMGQCLKRSAYDPLSHYDIGVHRYSIPSYRWSEGEESPRKIQGSRVKKRIANIPAPIVSSSFCLKDVLNDTKINDGAVLVLGRRVLSKGEPTHISQLRVYANSEGDLKYIFTFLDSKRGNTAAHGEMTSMDGSSVDMILKSRNNLESTYRNAASRVSSTHGEWFMIVGNSSSIPLWTFTGQSVAMYPKDVKRGTSSLIIEHVLCLQRFAWKFIPT